MKKLLILLFLVFLFSCKKDECYKCTTVITTTGSPYASSPVVTTVTSCGINSSEAKEIEKSMTSIVTVNMGGYSITSTSVCNCKKQ